MKEWLFWILEAPFAPQGDSIEIYFFYTMNLLLLHSFKTSIVGSCHLKKSFLIFFIHSQGRHSISQESTGHILRSSCFSLVWLVWFKGMYFRGFTKFGIKVLWRLQFLEYLRTLRLKFQKARTKIEVVLSLPCWLSQLNWDSQQGRLRTTSILVRAFWNFKLKVLKYSRSCSLHNTLIPWSLKITWIT